MRDPNADLGKRESEEINYGGPQAREWTINTGRTKQQTTTETYVDGGCLCDYKQPLVHLIGDKHG